MTTKRVIGMLILVIALIIASYFLAPILYDYVINATYSDDHTCLIVTSDNVPSGFSTSSSSSSESIYTTSA